MKRLIIILIVLIGAGTEMASQINPWDAPYVGKGTGAATKDSSKNIQSIVKSEEIVNQIDLKVVITKGKEDSLKNAGIDIGILVGEYLKYYDLSKRNEETTIIKLEDNGDGSMRITYADERTEEIGGDGITVGQKADGVDIKIPQKMPGQETAERMFLEAVNSNLYQSIQSMIPEESYAAFKNSLNGRNTYWQIGSSVELLGKIAKMK